MNNNILRGVHTNIQYNGVYYNMQCSPQKKVKACWISTHVRAKIFLAMPPSWC